MKALLSLFVGVALIVSPPSMAQDGNVPYQTTIENKNHVISQSNGEKIKQLHRAAEGGDSQSQYALFEILFEQQQSDDDLLIALNWLSKAAENGLAIAQYKLGWFLHHGSLVKQDHIEAEKWYKRAVEQGNAEALHQLNLLNKNLKKKADMGSGTPPVSTNLSGGTLVEQDKSIAHDCSSVSPLSTSIEILIYCGDKGDASAQFFLGIKYSDGDGVAQNNALAVKWHTKAAEQGHANAQANLGLEYWEGVGVKKDRVQAYVWFNLSASQGNKTAIEGKKFLQKIMTFEQITEAQKISTKLEAKIQIEKKRWFEENCVDEYGGISTDPSCKEHQDDDNWGNDPLVKITPVDDWGSTSYDTSLAETPTLYRDLDDTSYFDRDTLSLAIILITFFVIIAGALWDKRRSSGPISGTPKASKSKDSTPLKEETVSSSDGNWKWSVGSKGRAKKILLTIAAFIIGSLLGVIVSDIVLGHVNQAKMLPTLIVMPMVIAIWMKSENPSRLKAAMAGMVAALGLWLLQQALLASGGSALAILAMIGSYAAAIYVPRRMLLGKS